MGRPLSLADERFMDGRSLKTSVAVSTSGRSFQVDGRVVRSNSSSLAIACLQFARN
jgi:hypothetical protein